MRFTVPVLTVWVVFAGAAAPLLSQSPPPVARLLPPQFNVTPPDPQKTPALTLADLKQIALENNPSVVRAAALVDAAKGKWLQVGLYPNPVAGYHATEINNVGTAGQQGAIFGQKIVTAGKLKLNRKIAEQEIQRALHQLAAQQQRVLSDVRIHFYNALAAQERVRHAEKLVEIGEEVVEASERLYKGRLVGLNDVLRAQIEADAADILLGKAQNRHRAAWQRLAAVVGVSDLVPALLLGDLKKRNGVHPWNQLMSSLLNTSPELAAAYANVERARWKLRRAGVEVIPDVDVSVSVRHHNVTSDDVVNLQLGVPIPVFDRNQGNIRQAKAELAAAQSEVRRIELSLQNRLARAYQEYANALVQVQKYEQRILDNAEKSLKLVQQGYEKQQVNYLDLLLAQKTYFQVTLAYIEALRELHESAAVIQGQLLRSSLDNPE